MRLWTKTNLNPQSNNLANKSFWWISILSRVEAFLSLSWEESSFSLGGNFKLFENFKQQTSTPQKFESELASRSQHCLKVWFSKLSIQQSYKSGTIKKSHLRKPWKWSWSVGEKRKKGKKKRKRKKRKSTSACSIS